MDSKCINKGCASILYRIPPSDLHLSYTDRNYDSDDSNYDSACGRKFTTITAWVVEKHLKSLIFLNNTTSAQLALLSLVKP